MLADSTLARITGDRLSLSTARSSLGLSLAGIGRVGAIQPRVGVSLRSRRGEVVVARGDVEEHDVVSGRGIEQTFVVMRRPDGQGPIVLALEVDGARAKSAGRNGAVLVDDSGQAQAVYRDLAAVDAAGKTLSSHMEVQGQTIALVVDDANAAYPILVDPLVATEEAELSLPGPVPGESPNAIAIDGDVAVFGAPDANGYLGAAYVFTRSGGSWSQTQMLEGADAGPHGRFGFAVGITQGNILVGTCSANGGPAGAVYVFGESAGLWTQKQKLTRRNPGFGCTIATDGDTALIGRAASYPAGGGGAYAYVLSNGQWALQQQLLADDVNAPTGSQRRYGWSVAIGGDTAVVGAPYGGGASTDAAIVFTRASGTWTQEQLLTGNGDQNEVFGWAVAVSGDTAIVTSQGQNPTGGPGAAYVFTRTATVWATQEVLMPTSSPMAGAFGQSVALTGDVALIGMNESYALGGGAQVFTRVGTSWSVANPLSPTNPLVTDAFGFTVAMSGGTALVGSPNSLTGLGNVYVYGLPIGALGGPCGSDAECANASCVNGTCGGLGASSASSSSASVTMASATAVSSTSAGTTSSASVGAGGAAPGSTSQAVSTASTGGAASGGAGGDTAETANARKASGGCSIHTLQEGARVGELTALGLAVLSLRRRRRTRTR